MNSRQKTIFDPVTVFLIVVFIILCLLVFLFMLIQGGPFSAFPYRYLAPFSGKVIDADTGQPVPGAVVLVVYYIDTYSVAGGSSYIVDGRETLTDEQGEFSLPEKRKWLRLQRGYPRGKLTIFKPGFGVFPKHSRSEAIGVNKSWPPPEKHIIYKIAKLNTIEEKKNNVMFIHSFNYPMFIENLNEERKNIGLQPITRPNKGENNE